MFNKKNLFKLFICCLAIFAYINVANNVSANNCLIVTKQAQMNKALKQNNKIVFVNGKIENKGFYNKDVDQKVVAITKTEDDFSYYQIGQQQMFLSDDDVKYSYGTPYLTIFGQNIPIESINAKKILKTKNPFFSDYAWHYIPYKMKVGFVAQVHNGKLVPLGTWRNKEINMKPMNKEDFKDFVKENIDLYN